MDSHECPATKQCSKCLQAKPLADFYVYKGKYQSACKACINQVSKAWAEKNKARRAATSAARLETQRESIKQWMADYYQRNRQKVLERTREYQSKPEVKARETTRHQKRWLENRDKLLPLRAAEPVRAKVRAYSKRHYAANKSLYLAKWWERHCLKRKATPKWANRKAMHAFYAEAKRLTDETGIPHEVDHIIPLKGERVCGLHVENNLRVTTLAINRKKRNRAEDIV